MTSASGSRPNLAWSASHPATAPGTVTVWIPSTGISEKPRALNPPDVSPVAAQPPAFKPWIAPFDSAIITNRSPPMPFISGSTTPMTALAAMAASTAWPPRSSIWAPAWAASGWLAATMPSRVAILERPARIFILRKYYTLGAMPGRHFLQIPGPTNVPDRVLRAIAQPTIDNRGPDFSKLVKSTLDSLRKIFQTAGQVVVYPA